MTSSKLFLLLLLGSAPIAKSRWALIELEDEEDHGEAEKDGDEKVLRVKGGRLAKDQHHEKKKDQNHGRKKGEAGTRKDSQKDYIAFAASVSGGGAKPFISPYTGKAVRSF